MGHNSLSGEGFVCGIYQSLTIHLKNEKKTIFPSGHSDGECFGY